MHPFQIVLLVLVAAVVVVSVWMSVRSSIEERRDERRNRKKFGGPKTGTSYDTEDCDHAWRQWDSGTCVTGYSSHGGPDPQETWTVEQCSLCGARRFTCTGTCDCRSECAAPYGG